MSGKKFIIILFLILLSFALILFMKMYHDGWFDTFISGGFKALYGN